MLFCEPHGTVVELQQCSEDSAHGLSSIPGSDSWLEVDSTFHLSKGGKLSTQFAGVGGQCVTYIIYL